jgi:glucose/arabinose dehydrogenase
VGLLAAAVAGTAIVAARQPAPVSGHVGCGTAGLSLPPGFCATIFADKIGHARHMAVAADGTVYVNTWSGGYYRDTPPAGGFIVALRDSNGDGKADRIVRYGETSAEGAAGGTGIALYKGSVYAEVNDRIVSYRIAPDGSLPRHPTATIVTGMPLGGDHPMHPFVIDDAGNLFVNMGSATNACDVRNRVPNGPGHRPCTELETRAGVWRYDANKTGQRFSPDQRYATGIRNTGGLSLDRGGRLFGVQHGRDQLGQNWSKFYTAQQGASLPAEELLHLTSGADFGWPTCYFDGGRGQLMLAPEYGGDGKTIGPCAGKQGPVAAFPAHWAPNDLLIYEGRQFPSAYRGGAFIAFHGSWNRAPEPQQGYNVTFQPLADGRASGRYVVFADGFAGGHRDPGGAAARPAGLAMGPDGALYVADDQHGRIWRITYRGPAGAPLAGASPAQAAAPAPVRRTLAPPPGFSASQIALGEAIFHGRAKGGTCAGCHGEDAGGSSAGPSLVSGRWLWSDGSVGGIARVVATGVAKPKRSNGVMPPNGGAPLSRSDVQAVAAYVWALNRARK